MKKKNRENWLCLKINNLANKIVFGVMDLIYFPHLACVFVCIIFILN